MTGAFLKAIKAGKLRWLVFGTMMEFEPLTTETHENPRSQNCMETELRAETPPRPQYASLPDAWEQPDRAIPLNGLLERQQFAPWLTAFFGILLALILFHFIVGPIATFGILMAQGIPPMDVVNSLETVIAEKCKATAHC